MDRRKHWLASAVSGYLLLEIVMMIFRHYASYMLGDLALAALVSAVNPVRILTVVILAFGVLCMLIPGDPQKGGRSALHGVFPIVACVLQLIAILAMLIIPGTLAGGASAEVYYLTTKLMRTSALIMLFFSLIAALVGYFPRKPSFLRALILQVVFSVISVILCTVLIASAQMGIISFMLIGMVQPFAVLLPVMKYADPPEPKGNDWMSYEEAKNRRVAGTKSKTVAAILAFLLGGLGVHRYYLGYVKSGVAQSCGFAAIIIGYVLYIFGMITEEIVPLLTSVVLMIAGSCVGIWAFIDFIRILTDSLSPADGTLYSDTSAQSAALVTPTASGYLATLEKLSELHDKGILNDEEFERKKAQVLEKMQ